MNDSYIKAIDGLRAIAVIAVVINHFNEQYLPSGFLGVDIFFVISGFVITKSLLNYHSNISIKSAFLKFYSRRIKRLLPALILMVLTTLLVFEMTGIGTKSTIETGLWSLFGFSNFYLYFNEINYWGTNSEFNPYTHTWSLGVEEQFYLLYPLVIFFILFRLSQNKQLLGGAVFIILISVISFALNFLTEDTAATFYLSPFRFWELGLGCLLALVGKSWQFSNNNYQMGLSVVLTALLITTLFLPIDTGLIANVIVCLLTVGLIATLSNHYFSPLGTAPFTYLGKLSYSLYLWHWPILVYLKTLDPQVNVYIYTVAVIGMSMLSYHIVENKMRYLVWTKSFKIVVILIISVPFIFYLRAYDGVTDLQNVSIEDSSSFLCDQSHKGMTIRTIGNSHANHILPSLRSLADKCDANIIANRSPDTIVVPRGEEIDDVVYSEIFAPLEEGDLLILSSRNRFLYLVPFQLGRGDKWNTYFAKKNQQELARNGAISPLKIWLGQLDRILELAKMKSVNVVLILPTVEFTSPTLSYDMCIAGQQMMLDDRCNQSVDLDWLESRFPGEFFNEVYSRQEDSNLKIFDPIDIFCSEDTRICNRIVDGKVLFRDTNHYSVEGNALLEPHLLSFLIESGFISGDIDK